MIGLRLVRQMEKMMMTSPRTNMKTVYFLPRSRGFQKIKKYIESIKLFRASG